MSPSKTFNWGLAGAIVVGVVFLAFAGLSAKIYSDQPAHECAHQAEQHNPQPQTFTFRAEQNRTYRLDYYPQQHEQRETCAWGHNAEQWLALLTLWLVAGTVLLAAFTATLWLGSEESARRQREADAEAHRRELRAYVGISSFTLSVSPTEGGNTASANVAFANFGRTPALNLRTYGRFELLPWVGSPFFPVAERDPTASRATLGPTAERNRRSQLKKPFTWDEITPIGDKAADNVLLAWGTLVYEDVFGDEHRTYFKAYIGGNQPPANLRDGPTDYRMVTYWNGNGSD